MSDDFDDEVTEWNDEGNSGKLSVGEAIELVKDLPLKETVEGVFKSLGELFAYAREAKITDRELARYRNIRDTAITEITKRYELFDKIVTRRFDERRMVIEKLFEDIDNGLKNNNFELVIAGIQHVTAIVKDNPLKDFVEMLKLPKVEQHILLESGDLGEL